LQKAAQLAFLRTAYLNGPMHLIGVSDLFVGFIWRTHLVTRKLMAVKANTLCAIRARLSVTRTTHVCIHTFGVGQNWSNFDSCDTLLVRAENGTEFDPISSYFILRVAKWLNFPNVLT